MSYFFHFLDTRFVHPFVTPAARWFPSAHLITTNYHAILLQKKSVTLNQARVTTDGKDGTGNRIGFDFDIIMNDNAGETFASNYYYLNIGAGYKILQEEVRFYLCFYILSCFFKQNKCSEDRRTDGRGQSN